MQVSFVFELPVAASLSVWHTPVSLPMTHRVRPARALMEAELGTAMIMHAATLLRVQVGVVGLGPVGRAVAGRLASQGFVINCWGRSSPTEELGSGVRVVHELPDLVAHVDVALVCLRDAQSIVDRVPAALATQHEASRRSSIADVVLMTTLSPSEADAVATAVAAASEVSVSEAPLVGNVDDMAAGRSQILFGGDGPAHERLEKLLATLGTVRYVGARGRASALKLVVNAAVAPMMGMLAEALALAARADLDRSLVLDTLLGTRIGGLVDRKREMIEADDYPATSVLVNHYKDLSQVLDLAQDLGVSMQITSAAELVARRGVVDGWGDLDYASLVRSTLSWADRQS